MPQYKLLAKARMSSKGQITLPAALRDYLNVGPGDEIEFVEDEYGMQVRKVVPEPQESRQEGGNA